MFKLHHPDEFIGLQVVDPASGQVCVACSFDYVNRFGTRTSANSHYRIHYNQGEHPCLMGPPVRRKERIEVKSIVIHNGDQQAVKIVIRMHGIKATVGTDPDNEAFAAVVPVATLSIPGGTALNWTEGGGWQSQ